MEKSIESKVKGYYLQSENDDGILLRLVTNHQFTTLGTEKYVLFILDISGSMAGTILETCKATLQNMFRYLHNELQNKNIDLILFNTSTKLINLQHKSLDFCLESIQSIQASGGTSFIPVFQTIEKVIKENNKLEKEMCIILLSDGQAEKINQLESHISSLKIALSNMAWSSEFHSLGFGTDHDAGLLTALTPIGTNPGTFQYIKSAAEINQSIESVSGFFSQNTSSALFKFPNFESKIFFRDSTATPDDNFKFEAQILVEIKNAEFLELSKSFIVEIIENDKKFDFKIELSEDKLSDFNRIRMQLDLINYNLKSLTTKLTKEKFTQEQAEGLSAKLANYKVQLSETTRKIFRLKIDNRGPLLDDIKDIEEYILAFQKLIKENFINQLSNDQIATLNSMAYRDVTKKALLKKLDKRAVKSVPIINEAFEKVKQISSEINPKELTLKYEKEIDMIGTCLLTCYNFVEALADQDCLCITFDILRPEIAIADATRIGIKEIYPTIISAKSFLDSVKYAVKINVLASGGFNPEGKGSIVKGVSSENITAALPIYICPEHWQIATLLMKPILGWDITLDPVGYDYHQKKVIPFLLLSKALEKVYEAPNSEYNLKLKDLLLTTCIQIIKDDMEPSFQGTFKEDLTLIFVNYLQDGSYRTRDSIQSNQVFLSQLYCFTILNIIPKPSKEELLQMIIFMVEEDLRRKQDDWKNENINQQLISLLNIQVDKYGDRLMKIDLPNKSQQEVKKEKLYKLKFLNALSDQNTKKLTDQEKLILKSQNNDQSEENLKKENKEEIKTEKEKINLKDFIEIDPEDLTFASKFDSMTEIQKKAFKEYQDLYQTIFNELFIWLHHFYPADSVKLQEYNSLEKIGIDSVEKLLCLYIQNKLQYKSSDRKSAFTNKKYASPFSQEESKNFLEKVYKQVVLSKYQSKVLKPKDDMDQDSVTIFIKTNDLEEAAGILLDGISLGSFQHIQYMMRNKSEECQLVFDKLQMIRNKKYRGVTFNFDFDMRRRFLRKLKKKFPEYSYNKWREIWYCNV